MAGVEFGMVDYVLGMIKSSSQYSVSILSWQYCKHYHRHVLERMTKEPFSINTTFQLLDRYFSL